MINLLKPPTHFHQELEKDLSKTGIYIIWFIDNPNKFYAGSAFIVGHLSPSSKGFWCRWKLHLYLLKKNNHHSRYLQFAYNKYGINNIRFKIVEFVEDFSLSIKKEQIWIDNLDSYKNGYNCFPFARSPKNRNIPLDTYGKSVCEYDLKGNLVKKYISARQASRELSISYKVIHKCCVGLSVTYKNKIWRYENDKFDKYLTTPKIDVSKKKVKQYDLKNNLINSFLTISEASKFTKITLSNISMCLSGIRKKAGGYIWKS